MRSRVGRLMLSPVVVAVALTGSCTKDPRPKLSGGEAQAVVAFKGRAADYMALHEKLESTLPDRPERSTPKEVDDNQRALGTLIKEARRDAKPGDIFSPEIQALVRRVLAEVLSGPEGKTVKASIMDENPGVPKLLVNERYPSSIPLSTMPPQVLAQLPKLKGELEYRFIGSRLILLDTDADIILDFTDELFTK